MNIEKIKKNTVVKFMIIGAFAVLLSTVAFCIGQSFNNLAYDMSKTVEVVRTGDNTITFKELITLKNTDEFHHVAGYSELITGVSNSFGINEAGIKVVVTDAEYALAYKYDMLEGSFPDSQAINRGEAYAVISDLLAVKLFKSIDVVGSKINLLEKEYTVAGLYKSSGSTLLNMCQDGFDRVFIPYSSVENRGEQVVDVIALLRKPEQSIIETKAILDKYIGRKASSYRIIDYSVSRVVIHQYFNLALFIIGAFAILHTFIFIIKCTINTARYIKKKSDCYYIPEIIKTDTKLVISYLSVILLCCISIVLLIKNIQFEFVIADRYIPEDNIFDIGFYARVFMYDIMVSNSYTNKVNSLLEYIYRNALAVELFCTLMFAIFFCVTLMLRKILLSLGIRKLRMFGSYFIIMFAGGIAGIGISALMGLEVCLPAKFLIVVTYYYLVAGQGTVLCPTDNNFRGGTLASHLFRWHIPTQWEIL